MEIPKFFETFIPILDVLSDGQAINVNQLVEKVIGKFYSSLPAELLNQKIDSGSNLLGGRISWGKSYLKSAKMLEQPERGVVRITPKGLSVLKKGTLSLQELKNDSDFVEREKMVKSRIKNSSEESLVDDVTPEERVETGIRILESQVKINLLEKLVSINPYYFEKVVLQLLNKMGYGDFVSTPKSGDGGIDGVINEDQLGLDKIYVQAKRYAHDNFVHETDIRNFIGAMSRDTNKGVFVTTSRFDQGAIKKAHEAQHKIILIDGSKLVDLMHDYGVGVQVKNTYEVKEMDEDFFEEN